MTKLFQTGGLTLAQVNLIATTLRARSNASAGDSLQTTDDLIVLAEMFENDGANLIPLDDDPTAEDQKHAEANGDPDNTGDQDDAQTHSDD